jgi:hypothetical protein
MPANIKARYCFESEMVKIPATDVYLEIQKDTFLGFDEENENLITFTYDQFVDIYIASDKRSQKYFEFISDSVKNEYHPTNQNLFDVLIEEVKEELLEKEISLTLQGRFRLIWDLILGKKINILKY